MEGKGNCRRREKEKISRFICFRMLSFIIVTKDGMQAIKLAMK